MWRMSGVLQMKSTTQSDSPAELQLLKSETDSLYIVHSDWAKALLRALHPGRSILQGR